MKASIEVALVAVPGPLGHVDNWDAISQKLLGIGDTE
jgi:hypothetical protein